MLSVPEANQFASSVKRVFFSGKKRKRPHCFETDPSIRRRQQTRLLRELKATIDEYTTRIGQQAVVMIVTPGKPNDNFKVFGAQPLENVMRDLLKSAVIQELENALAQHAPAVASVNGTGTIASGSVTTNGSTDGVHDLPPLVIDGEFKLTSFFRLLVL